MQFLQVIMIGDVVGEAGLLAIEALLPSLIEEYKAAFVVVNGENVAEGFGITSATLNRILNAGADVVTSGNHVWEKREFYSTLEVETRVLRPANYPAGNAGHGWIMIEKAGLNWLVVNLQGRELMTPIDCPFKTFDTIKQTAQTRLILVDFHAEVAKEKEALAHYLDGRASLVVGTHTHVQTSDERILSNGTGCITDLGMTGVMESVIGMDKNICLERARTQILFRMECAKGVGTVQGIVAGIDPETGKTHAIQRLSRKA
ncbi:MAG: YmdB family metallophosphoesterase [Treponema sp.]|jgi:metallophosphoesterase (TIGR00282 family)|nr:YmdB family metallophosphoesterase [Treponema sp.]